MSICNQKIEVTYQSSQEILNIKEYSNLISWEHEFHYEREIHSKITGSACFFHQYLSTSKKPKSDIETAKRY